MGSRGVGVSMDTVFENRAEAGRRLGERLSAYKDQSVIVLALPRGGVVVAHEVAAMLGAPLDVLVVRKLGAPGRPELGFGAIAPGGIRIVDNAAVTWLGITPEQLEEVTAHEEAELRRRLQQYRGDRPIMDVRGLTLIVVDDGLATGGTARAAIASLRQRGAGRIVLAVPVCALETARAIEDDVDELVCLSMPEDFRAVGHWYDHFDQVPDEQVMSLLNASTDS